MLPLVYAGEMDCETFNNVEFELKSIGAWPEVFYIYSQCITTINVLISVTGFLVHKLLRIHELRFQL